MSRFTLTEHFDECLVLETKFGKLVAWVVRDDEDFKEFAIDLIGNDGKEYQVACIGTEERDFGDGFECSRFIHSYLWDGHHPDDIESYYMDPHGDGWYYDAKEDIA